MTQKGIYIQRLAAQMRSEGTDNWSYSNMADLCDLAGIWDEWINSTKQNEGQVTLKAAQILGVEIRHYIPA
ncbi:hypothetical protein [Anaerosinus massiliensis]|uniref:hypothetical protein n=1 Tax=Massilibacillus massiliensis TaxID=1806837 RepID=UPI000DA5FEFA|nr:hypothetical protein [Massilibacillus massiliensis]